MTTSFAVTAFQEMSPGRQNGRKLADCLDDACHHGAIDEVVVVDDGSGDFEELRSWLAKHSLEWDFPIRLFHSDENQGVFGNKLEAIACSTSDWVITCDSDNVMDTGYINQVIAMFEQPDTWYLPSFARPQFDYRSLVGEYDLTSIGEMLRKPMAECAMNTGNQIVHRKSFVKVFEKYRGRRFDLMMPNRLDVPETERADHYWRLVWGACDSFIYNMEWLLAGNRIQIVPGLEYDHHYSSGPDSNYVRAPKEKETLNRLLVAELIAKSRDAGAHERVKRGDCS